MDNADFEPIERFNGPLVQVLPANDRGRDFVAGDLHGAFDLLQRALDRANYDPAADRILLCGDLLDRGARSRDVLDILQLPGLHSVRGNHCDAFVQIIGAGLDPAVLVAVMGRGAAWVFKETDEHLHDIALALSHLPVVMETECERGTVGIVHADVPLGMSWGDFKRRIEAGDTQVIECALESRDRIHSDNHEGVPGIGRLYVGHTPQMEGAQAWGNVFALDTGAVFGERGRPNGHLTLANIAFATLEIHPAHRAAPQDLVTVLGDMPVRGPFGASTVLPPPPAAPEAPGLQQRTREQVRSFRELCEQSRARPRRRLG